MASVFPTGNPTCGVSDRLSVFFLTNGKVELRTLKFNDLFSQEFFVNSFVCSRIAC